MIEQKSDEPIFNEISIVLYSIVRSKGQLLHFKKLVDDCISGVAKSSSVVHKPPTDIPDALTRVYSDGRIPAAIKQDRFLELKKQIEGLLK